MNKGFFTSMPTATKVLLFISLLIVGAGLGTAAGLLVAKLIFHVPLDRLSSLISQPQAGDAEILLWINNAAQLFTFLIPALTFALLLRKEVTAAWARSAGLFLIIGPVYILLSSAAIDFSHTINQWLIPEGSWLESILKPTELAAQEMLKVLLGDSVKHYLLLACISITLIPAICEELVFRGVLQPLLIRLTKNHHAGIWIAAALFSAIHLQFYGFLPRLILGALMGYLVVWSGSLWTAIAAHFTNNALAFWLFLEYGTTETPKDTMADDLTTKILLFGVFAAGTFYLHRTWQKQNSKTEEVAS